MEGARPIVSLVVPSRTYVMAGGDASAVDGERLAGLLEGLESLGFEVVRTPGPWRSWKRFGGTDAERLAEFQAALEDPDVDLVLPVRGGYGMARILPGLDWKAIAKRRPLAMGFSDFTAFSLALYAKTGLPSWQGPMAGGLAPGHTTPASLKNFLSALSSSSWGAGWARPEGERSAGRADGVLWGGNLSMIVSLLATPFFPKEKQVKGGILYLEDVGEAAYRVDRMLLQLWQSGVLESQKAVVFGCFTGADRHAAAKGDFMLEDVIGDFSKRLREKGILVASGLPFGHIDELMAIPFGVSGSLELAEDGAARLAAAEVPSISRGREALLAKLEDLRAGRFPPGGLEAGREGTDP